MRLGVRAFGWGLAVAALVGGWLLLAGTVDVVEVAAATVAGVVAVTVGVLAHRHSGLEHRPDPLLARRAGHLMRDALGDLVWCVRVLWRHARGRGRPGEWVTVPFAATGDSPDDVARRTAIAVAGSIGATTYVADIDIDEGTVLVHRLIDTGRDPLPRELLDAA